MIKRAVFFFVVLIVAGSATVQAQVAGLQSPNTKTAYSKGSTPKAAGDAKASWSFAVSGDSRNCGDFVMPAIAARVKAEGDVLYWHQGDFRAMQETDQDMASFLSAGQHLSHEEYIRSAWDDFIARQLAPFGDLPVFLGRGNHETVKPMTREGYITKFESWLNRPEIVAQRERDGVAAAPLAPWYHWTREGVDFITLDNSTRDEFSDAQLTWLRGVLDRDLKLGSGIHTILVGMHDALPHSLGAEHAMDDWDSGIRTGELVYRWLYDAQAAGQHVYILASHSHYYSPNVFNTAYWKQYSKTVVPGWIIGSAGARRYPLPQGVDPTARTHFYGYMQGTVQADGAVTFTLHEISEGDMVKNKWPDASLDAIHECSIHNAD